jgi:AcrR family transcriptional regulator
MKKGLETRDMLLEESRNLFNRKGTDLTLATIAAELKVNRSMITNHFPKKQDLIYSLVNQYEEKLSVLRAHEQNQEDVSFRSQAAFLSKVLDVSFSYRGVISYVLVIPAGEEMLEASFAQTYKRNVKRTIDRIHALLDRGMLSSEILDPVSLKSFEIQYMTLVSTWFITYGLYYKEKDYKKMKPYVLMSMFNAYLPFLTEAGKQQMEELRQSLFEGEKSLLS